MSLDETNEIQIEDAQVVEQTPTDLNVEDTRKSLNEITEEDFNKQLQDLAENPDLQVIANVVVNLLAEQSGQIQTNIVHSVFMNTILELLFKNKVISEEDFQELYPKNLQEADERVQQSFQEAQDKAVEEMQSRASAT